MRLAIRQRRSGAIAGLSPLRIVRMQRPLNFAPPPASPAFGVIKANAPKPNDLLAPIYGWFTEGFDTPVLKDAKTLLDELV
jgi:hypothetical protein